MPPDPSTTIRDGLAIGFTGPDALVEVRVLKTPYRVISGYFDGLDAAVIAVTEAVTQLNGTSSFYFTLNPVRPDVHARAANRLKPYADITTADCDILRRAWLLVDVDPIRPAGVSATDAELALALAVRDTVAAWLTTQGWPAPIQAMSGNGGHNLYAIDMPNDDATRDLVKACLATIEARFATPAVSIDRAVYNAARISKLYGTVARKGDPTSNRPHRLATIDAAPPRVCVTSTQLAALAVLQPAVPPTTARVPVFMSGNIPATRPSPGLIGSYRPSPRLDMREEFVARSWYLHEIRPGWHAVRCPWIAAHSSATGDRETAIREPDTPDGVWGFKCLHDHCTRRTIRDVWELFRPTPEPLDPASPFAPQAPAIETPPAIALDPAALDDACVVAAEGKRIAAEGVPYLVDELIPAYGMLGMLVAYAKVGKTSFGLALGGAVAVGQPFLDRDTRQARVLIVAAEDPPEYTAYLARHLDTVPAGALSFYRRPILLDSTGLQQIVTTVTTGGYGLVLIASWQAVVRGLLREENDNANAVRVVEAVKAATRLTGIPWLIDAHSGKGEDQSDDADPNRAMRGASAAAGAADYTLSLRYGNGTFGTRRRLSGKGRFVAFPPLVLDYSPADGTYTVIGTTKAAGTAITWQMICETGALTEIPQTAGIIAQLAGLAAAGGRVSAGHRRRVKDALHLRPGVRTTIETRRGQVTTLYARHGEAEI